MANKEAISNLDLNKLQEVVIEVFSVLNKNKVSPEEGFYIAQEILATSIERFENTNNISIDDIKHKLINDIKNKLIDVMMNSVAAPAEKKKRAIYIVGQDRGWVGNQNTLTEDN
jgi:hypothetical protein